jgi:hypothetical protein
MRKTAQHIVFFKKTGTRGWGTAKAMGSGPLCAQTKKF